jgi:protein TonB
VFNRLPESKPQRQRRTGGAIVSTVVHLVFIALAVKATGLKAETGPKSKPEIAIYVPAPSPKPKVERIPDRPRVTSPTAPPAGPAIDVPELPNLKEITIGIPDPGQLTNLEDWERRGLVADRPSTGNGNGSMPSALGGPLPESVVEKTIFAIPGTGNPRYPSMLQSAGVEGDVRAQFIVDTLGRVEAGSVKILATSHDLFGASVRDALMRARFTPAEAGGRKVRQLAEQVFTFTIKR